MENWINRIDLNTQMFLDSFGSLNEEQLNWKPNPKKWSIAQNINHLIVINESYFSIFANLKQGKNQLPFIAHFGFMVNFFGGLIKKFVQPDRKKKMTTLPIWEPAKSNFSKNVLADFEEHQTELKNQIQNLNEYFNGKTVISSPANRLVVYKLETALDIIITHEERHYNQAKEILEQLEKTVLTTLK